MTSDLQVGTVTNWTESVGISEWIPDQRPFIHLPTSVDSCIGSQIGIPAQRAHSSINPLMWIGFRVTDWHLLTSLSIKNQRSGNAQNTGILALRDLFCHCKIALCIQRSTTTGGILGHVNCTPECFSSALSTSLLHMLICIFFHLGPLTVSRNFTPLAPCCLRPLTLKPPNPNLTSLESTKMLQTLKVRISFPTIFKFRPFRGTCSKTEKISSWLSYNWDACTSVSCSSSLNKIILFGYW